MCISASLFLQNYNSFVKSDKGRYTLLQPRLPTLFNGIISTRPFHYFLDTKIIILAYIWKVATWRQLSKSFVLKSDHKSDRAHVAFRPREAHLCSGYDISPPIPQGMSALSIREMCALTGGESEPEAGNPRTISIPGFNLTHTQITLRQTDNLWILKISPLNPLWD